MSDGRRVPDFVLEQFALGELPLAERSRVESALEEDPLLRERLEEIRRSDEDILATYPPAEIAAEIRRTEARSRRPKRFPHPLFAISAAAAAFVLVGVVAFKDILFPSSIDMTRPKGGAPSLSIFRKTPAGAEELREGSPAYAGDLLQIRYAAGGSRYGAVFSIDGRGAITFHLPEGYKGEEAAAPILDARGAALASAYELDDAPLFERFYIVSSSAAFDLAAPWKAARGLAAEGPESRAPRLPEGVSWSALTLVKKEGAR